MLAGAFVVGGWAVIAGLTWLIARSTGLAPVGVAMAVTVAALLLGIAVLLAVSPPWYQEWGVRQSIPREDQLTGPWTGFGDIRPQDFPGRNPIVTGDEDTTAEPPGI
jgi:hypothetical protein